MLFVVTIRSEGERFAHNHIAHAESVMTFCGIPIPQAVTECGLDNPRNPYVGRGVVTCDGCISEFSNGRREGYRS